FISAHLLDVEPLPDRPPFGERATKVEQPTLFRDDDMPPFRHFIIKWSVPFRGFPLLYRANSPNFRQESFLRGFARAFAAASTVAVLLFAGHGMLWYFSLISLTEGNCKSGLRSLIAVEK